ncbi:MAG: RagB/SusD family nutrient uptake outer membrane protein [Flavobacteriales bacterium]|nr:MAG: RagB/SusD family nutrient uptake outer membrane protein [Flavobacteriales bacterium]
MKIISSSFLVLSLFAFYSCTKNLNQSPAYGLNSEVVYSDPNNYINVLSKLYSGLSMTGLQGPAGQADIAGIDEGFSAYVRVLWNLQELPTDEAVCGWNDPGIPSLNKMQWNADDGWVKGMYYRIYYQITLCNEFIYQSRDERLDERGFSDSDKEMIRMYRNEARFLRSLSYFHAMDLFGNVPFVTEEDRVGAFQPQRIERTDLFNYVESELIDLSNVLSAAGTVNYGRATREAAKTLLAKIYLNAEVYSGTDRYDDCRNYCEQVINSGVFQLDMDYQHLFLADNQNSSEVIFPVVYDGLYAQTWGGTTYLVCGALGGSMNAADYGVNGKWGGLRSTSAFVNKFPDTTEDSRFLFYRDGQELEITNLGTFTQGYAYPKYKNVTSVGDVGSNNGTSAHVDIDFPMFRLADVYLMLAESAYRNGDQGTALNFINMLRERAYGNSNNNMSSMSLDDILDERSRELAWEGSRRTDLIRFGKFTSGDYVWPFKGGDVIGIATSSHLELYPIPTSDLILNPNLTQNPGY